jgi:hypothetical protein
MWYLGPIEWIAGMIVKEDEYCTTVFFHNELGIEGHVWM